MAQCIEKSSAWAQGISAAVRCGALGHAVILSGSGDKEPYARYLAAALICREHDAPCFGCRDCRKALEGIHPDILWVHEQERKELSADEVRQLRQDVYIRPNEGERKVYVFTDAGQLNERDQNILLKIVEEGPAYAAFIFCTDTSSRLLPTVRSRCTEYFVPAEEIDAGTAGELIDVICRKDRTALCAYFAGQESRRLGREDLKKILQCAWAVCAEAQLRLGGKRNTPETMAAMTDKLCRSFSCRQLQKMTDLLAQYGAECNYNVGEGHILGALAVEMEGVIS